MLSIHLDTALTWRGGQNQALLTVKGLRARGHRTVLVAHPDGELARRAGEDADLVRLATRGEVDFSAAWRLGRLLRDVTPDVIHAHDPHGVAVASLALSMTSPSPRPALVASRRVDFHLKTNSFSRWKYHRVDCFIAASDAIRTILIEDGISPDRVVTVHEGIDIDRIAAIQPASVHKEFWVPAGMLVVGNVAALVPHKGQRHLVDAAAIVVRKVPEARFLIFGEGELQHALEHQIRERGLEKYVRLVGFRPDVLAFLKTFDIFVMSSVTEGLGTSLLDAMAASRPIVATRAGGIPEVVVDEETGLLARPGDDGALAAALVRLLRDERLRRRMGEAGLARVRERFSVDRMVDATLAVYRATGDRRVAADTASSPSAD